MVLAACGTTSGLEAPTERPTIDLTAYNKLLVEDFTDEATAKLKPEARPLLEPKIAAGTRMFPDQIASVVKAGGGFDEVARSGTPDAQTLVLRGTVWRRSSDGARQDTQVPAGIQETDLAAPQQKEA